MFCYKFSTLLRVGILAWLLMVSASGSLEKKRDAQKDKSMIYQVKNGMSHYCTFGPSELVAGLHGHFNTKCHERFGNMVHILPDGTKTYPFLNYGFPGGFVLNCTANISHGSLQPGCNRLIHSRCDVTCDPDSKPVVSNVTCDLSEDVTNVTAVWSVPEPCIPEGGGEQKEGSGFTSLRVKIAIIAGAAVLTAIGPLLCYFGLKGFCGQCVPEPISSVNSSRDSLQDKKAQVPLIAVKPQDGQPPKQTEEGKPQSTDTPKEGPDNKSADVSDQTSGLPGSQVSGDADQKAADTDGSRDAQSQKQPAPSPDSSAKSLPESPTTLDPDAALQENQAPALTLENNSLSDLEIDKNSSAKSQEIDDKPEALKNIHIKEPFGDNLLPPSLSMSQTSLSSNPRPLAPDSPIRLDGTGLSDQHITDYPSGRVQVLPNPDEAGLLMSYWGSGEDYSKGRNRAEPPLSDCAQSSLFAAKRTLEGPRADETHSALKGSQTLPGCATNVRELMRGTTTRSCYDHLRDLLEPLKSRDYRHTLEGYVTETQKQLERLGFRDLQHYKMKKEKYESCPTAYLTDCLMEKMASCGDTIPNLLEYFEKWNQEIFSLILKLHDCKICHAKYKQLSS